MTELKSEGPGAIRIADDVLAVIAGAAALESDGVAGLAGIYSSDVNNKAVRKNIAKGVAVKVTGDSVALSLAISVKLGAKLQDVSREVQQRVKGAVETMTGLAVSEVNISVGALVDENKRRM
ncbi:MAG: Asp23/Gls24 family envelope stress response protein [Defluviitaleaceae bacterium]|nr:Asp23/Gls24 family envelope stress response protein [Defluviitaleaceae bacterium]